MMALYFTLEKPSSLLLVIWYHLFSERALFFVPFPGHGTPSILPNFSSKELSVSLSMSGAGFCMS